MHRRRRREGTRERRAGGPCTHSTISFVVGSPQHKIFSTACRNPLWPFVVLVNDDYRRRQMPQYLVAGYLPDDFDQSQVDEATVQEIHALNREMIAAGVRKFAGGLGPAKSLRGQPDGRILITDGPYLEA